MTKFLIFYKSGQDRLSRVSDIFDQAEACMAATAKSFAIRHVDLLNPAIPTVLTGASAGRSSA